MIDERQIREMLHRRAEATPATAENVGPAIRRARRRIALVIGSTALGVALVALGAFAGARELTGAREHTPADRQTIRPQAVATLAFIGEDGLWVVTADGADSHAVLRTGPVNGATFGYQDFVWSPDGARIAFIGGVPGGGISSPAMDLAVMNADGSSMRRLTDCTGTPGGKEKGFCDGLSWSPDGTRIVFSGEHSLFVVEPATGAVRQITGCASCEHSGMALDPAWSPDGTRIAFNGDDSVEVIEPDGSGWMRLATGHDPGRPEWSLDGTRIVFGANDGVHVVDRDGSNPRRLVPQDVEETPGAPAWSPDGTRIAYVSTPGTESKGFVLQVWVMNADGTGKTRLYQSPCCIQDWQGPAWSPDGRSVAFKVGGINVNEAGIYVIGADSTGLHRLSTFQFGYGDLVWKPNT